MSASNAARKIVAGLYISLDGVVEGGKWQSPYFNAEIMEGITAGIAQADAVLLGGAHTNNSPRSGQARAAMCRWPTS